MLTCEVHRGTQVILAIGRREGIISEQLNIPITWGKPDGDKPIDPDKPLIWNHHFDYHIVMESYDFMEKLKTYSVYCLRSKT